MLHLAYRTPPEWAHAALSDPSRLLQDHAFCEDKAAASARMLGRLDPRLSLPMWSLEKEEEGHAALCRRFLKERGAGFAPPHRDPYVSQLRRQALGLGPGDLLDKLLVAAMIEARSCERFRLLADACRGSAMGSFYEDLFAAEARHHVLFVDLSTDLFGDRAEPRLGEISAIEARIARARPWGPSIH
jgi:tRNA-(ms[2]io[6]A)-hydroxylase